VQQFMPAEEGSERLQDEAEEDLSRGAESLKS
jgi:hypothetical protein